jgi:hypothetical protein
MKNFIFLAIFSFWMVSCTQNPLKINVSNVKVDLKIKHLDIDLLKLKPEEIPVKLPELKKSYGEFFNIFTYQMIGIGGEEQSNFHQMLNSFVTDTLILHLKTVVAQNVDTLKMRKQLEEAFKHCKYYFPAKELPEIYTCISGFNQSVVIGQNTIGVSLDKYLGTKNSYYEKLGIPTYKRKNMYPDKMVVDMIQAWANAEWPKSDKDNTLFSYIIQEGKILYFLDAMFPNAADTLKVGFTKKQLDFCINNQAKMWTYLAEHKMLFVSDRMSIKRFIDDAPYTAQFTEEAPGRSGGWIGWQIVRSYMKEHPGVKLPELMNNQNCQEILSQSGYRP